MCFSGTYFTQPLYHHLPNFRHPSILKKNTTFLINDPTKASVLCMLKDGLGGVWKGLPPAGVPVTNFLKVPEAIKKMPATVSK